MSTPKSQFLDTIGLSKLWDKMCDTFPSRTGDGATGTWNININGNAATATTATHASTSDNASNSDKLAGKTPDNYVLKEEIPFGKHKVNGEIFEVSQNPLIRNIHYFIPYDSSIIVFEPSKKIDYIRVHWVDDVVWIDETIKIPNDTTSVQTIKHVSETPLGSFDLDFEKTASEIRVYLSARDELFSVSAESILGRIVVETITYLSDEYLPDTVLKTTPQTLSDTDKNQALANLGIPFISGDGKNSAVLKESENKVIGKFSIALGYGNNISSDSSAAFGYNNIVENNCCTAEGVNNKVCGDNSHVEGRECIVEGHESHAEGNYTKVYGHCSHGEGTSCRVLGDNSHAEGLSSVVYGHISHVEGQFCAAGDLGQVDKISDERTDYGCHAEGIRTTAKEMASHSEGMDTHAMGIASHTEGRGSYTSGDASHAEGLNTKSGVKGFYFKGIDIKNKKIYLSTTQPNKIKTSGFTSSDFENIDFPYDIEADRLSIINGNIYYDCLKVTQIKNKSVIYVESLPFTSVAEFNELFKNSNYTIFCLSKYKLGTVSVSFGCHSEGYETRSFGFGSHSDGYNTIAKNVGEHASGIYNVSNGDTQFSIGIGTSVTDRKNAFEVKQNGDIYIEGVDGRIQDKLNGEVGGGQLLINITYSELKSLRDNSQLVPGQQYRITDYVTTTSQSNTSSAGHQFDIIVTVDDVNVLNENARAIQHTTDENDYFSNSDLNAWELKYCLDNDTNRFAWAVTSGKGVIYYMKDEWNNECPYDFKNIQFARWELSNPVGYRNDFDVENESDNWIQESTPFDSLKTGFYGLNGSENVFYYRNDEEYEYYKYKVVYTISESPTYCYTFGKGSDYSISGGNYGNVIKEYKNSNKIQLNNIVFLSNYCYSNSFGNNCYSNSFGNGCYSNSFGNYCYDNSFGSFCYSNSFGNSCSSNSFGKSYDYNSFGNNCYYNSFGNSCYSNSFGNSCDSNSFGNSCDSNSFGNSCCDNSFGNSCYFNSFGEGCYSNSFGNSCHSNSFGNSCHSNSFGIYCYSNSFGNICSSNSLGDNCSSNSFGIYCFSNSLGDNCYSNSFGNYCYSNSFGNYCSFNSFGNSCYSNSFGESSSNPKSYYRYIIFDNGNSYINLNCTSTTSSSKYYQNVRIGLRVNNTGDKTINDSNVGQTYETYYKPANSQTITI